MLVGQRGASTLLWSSRSPPPDRLRVLAENCAARFGSAVARPRKTNGSIAEDMYTSQRSDARRDSMTGSETVAIGDSGLAMNGATGQSKVSAIKRLYIKAATLDRFGMAMLRLGLVVVLVWIGGLTFVSYQADSIVPLAANSPFMSFLARVARGLGITVPQPTGGR